MNKNIFLVLILIALGIFIIPAYGVTYKGCQDGLICDVTLDLTTGATTYENCQSCGQTTQICQDGSVAFCNKVCTPLAFDAYCAGCIPFCNATPTTLTKLLYFTVYIPKELNITISPAVGVSTKDSYLTYTFQLHNPNPIELTVAMDYSVMAPDRSTPSGWAISGPTEIISLPAKGIYTNTILVHSGNSSNGDYVITARAAYLLKTSLAQTRFKTATAIFRVGARASPSVRISPALQTGIPGQKLYYNLTVFNNDPVGLYDANQMQNPICVNIFYLPAGWSEPSFIGEYGMGNCLLLNPGTSRNITVGITSNLTAEERQHLIGANATFCSYAGDPLCDYFGIGYFRYNITYCGDGICDFGEENPSDPKYCPADCPPSNFSCSGGRCERKTDTGVNFTTSYSGFRGARTFIVCNKGATVQACQNAYDYDGCGFNLESYLGSGQPTFKPCFCGSNIQTSCHMTCVDGKGAYYFLMTGIPPSILDEVSTKFSFECPNVRLLEIRDLRDGFQVSIEGYQQTIAVLETQMNEPGITDSQKASLQGCHDALELILVNITTHKIFLDDVLLNPGVINTNEARARSQALRNYENQIYNQYCRAGASGFLQIESLNIQDTEINKTAALNVNVKNIGTTIRYYGYTLCELTAPDGTKIVFGNQSECSRFEPGALNPFNYRFNATSIGEWDVKCTVIGSLLSSCASEVHDIEETTFTVYTREIFIQAVSGRCEAGTSFTCDVMASRPGDCVGCRIGNSECVRTGNDGNIIHFSCPSRDVGVYNLTGHLSLPSSPSCLIREPSEINTTVLCPGCGDNQIVSSEQCEPPETANNTACSQGPTCDGTKYIDRDFWGFCHDCQCIQDEPRPVCIYPHCGAECSDFATWNTTITQTWQDSCAGRKMTDYNNNSYMDYTYTSCNATKQCAEECTWTGGICEPPQPSTKVMQCINSYCGANCSQGEEITYPVSRIWYDYCQGKELIDYNNDTYNNSEISTCNAGLVCSDDCDFVNVTCYPPEPNTTQIRCAEVCGAACTDGELLQTKTTRWNDTCNGSRITDYNNNSYFDSIDTSCNVFSVCVNNCSVAGIQDCTPQVPSTKNDYCSRSCGAQCTKDEDCNDGNNLSFDFCAYNCTCIHDFTCPFDCDDSCTDDVFPPNCEKRMAHGSGGCGRNEICCEKKASECPSPFRIIIENPKQNSIVTDSVNVRAVAIGDVVSIYFAVSRFSSSCSGSEFYPMTSSDSAAYEATWNTLLNEDGTYYVCAKGTLIGGLEAVSSISGVIVDNYDFSINPLRASAFAGAGGTISYTAVLKNNGRSDTFVLTKTSSMSWPIALTINGEEKSSITLANGESAQVLLTVSVPGGANRNDFATNTVNIESASSRESKSAKYLATVGAFNRNPTMSNLVYPYSVRQNDPMTISLVITDPDGDSINEAKICRTSACNEVYCNLTRAGSSYTCSIRATMSTGRNEFYVFAKDSRDGSTLSDENHFIVFIGSGPSGPPGPCSAIITGPSCYMSELSNRYYANATVTWSGGNHAHIDIENDKPRQFTSPFYVNHIVSSPGWKTIRAFVHDDNETELCYDSKDVYCTSGFITGQDVALSRIIGDVVAVGRNEMRLVLSSAAGAKNVKLKEMTQGLTIASWYALGNSSALTMSGPTDQSYMGENLKAYEWTMDIEAEREITIVYATDISQQGSYKFIGEVRYGNDTTMNVKTIYASSCQDLTPRKAIGPGNICNDFTTICEVPAGWKVVSDCDAQPEQESKGDLSLFIWIAAIVIVLAFIWFFKDKLMELMKKIRYRLYYMGS